MQKLSNIDRLYNFFVGDDLDFYEEFLIDLSDGELDMFFKENPDFLQEYNMYEGRRELLRDKKYREILRGIYKK